MPDRVVDAVDDLVERERLAFVVRSRRTLATSWRASAAPAAPDQTPRRWPATRGQASRKQARSSHARGSASRLRARSRAPSSASARFRVQEDSAGSAGRRVTRQTRRMSAPASNSRSLDSASASATVERRPHDVNRAAAAEEQSLPSRLQRGSLPPPTVSRPRRPGVGKRVDVDLEPARFVRSIGQPAAVGRDHALRLVERRLRVHARLTGAVRRQEQMSLRVSGRDSLTTIHCWSGPVASPVTGLANLRSVTFRSLAACVPDRDRTPARHPRQLASVGRPHRRLRRRRSPERCGAAAGGPPRTSRCRASSAADRRRATATLVADGRDAHVSRVHRLAQDAAEAPASIDPAQLAQRECRRRRKAARRAAAVAKSCLRPRPTGVPSSTEVRRARPLLEVEPLRHQRAVARIEQRIDQRPTAVARPT